MSKIITNSVKTGFKNTYGNKGFILTRFKINDTNIAICSAHLKGKFKCKDNYEELSLILNSCFHEKENKSFTDNDIYFIIGDLNFKVNSKIDINEVIKDKNYSNIAEIDEFTNFSKHTENKELLKDTVEGKIQFPPTHQFINNSKNYNNKKLLSWYTPFLFTGVTEFYSKILSKSSLLNITL